MRIMGMSRALCRHGAAELRRGTSPSNLMAAGPCRNAPNHLRRALGRLARTQPYPAPTDDMAPYANLPILVLFGDYVDEFPRWAPRLKNCRAFVAAANAAGGGEAELLVLPDIGIKGNTHMLMQDDNSLDIADILLDWIGKHVTVVQ